MSKKVTGAIGSLLSNSSKPAEEVKPKKTTTKKAASKKPAKKKKQDPEYMMLRLSKEAHRIAKVKASIKGKKLIDFIEDLIRADKTEIKI